MIFQMFALHGLLLHYTYVAIDFHLVGMYFLWISTVVSLWSGGLYTAKVARADPSAAARERSGMSVKREWAAALVVISVRGAADSTPA